MFYLDSVCVCFFFFSLKILKTVISSLSSYPSFAALKTLYWKLHEGHSMKSRALLVSFSPLAQMGGAGPPPVKLLPVE